MRERQVLIVSRTRMQSGICVGGICTDTCELIRIHNEHGGNLSEDAPYAIGDVWLMNVETAWNVRPKPHVEDKQTEALKYVGNIGIRGIDRVVKEHASAFGNRLTKGALGQAFEGCLVFDQKPYLRYCSAIFVTAEQVPSFSTQFWIADADLFYKEDQYGKPRYLYKNVSIKFVGLQDTVERIPAGTLLRLSLAHWWDNGGAHEKRCYLQLSGWYL